MEAADYVRFGAAFLFVCGLIGVLALLLRRYGMGGKSENGRHRARLEVTERLALDAKHQAFILRRDNVEHLLIKNVDRVFLVESGFEPAKTAHDLDSDEDSLDENPHETLVPTLKM